MDKTDVICSIPWFHHQRHPLAVRLSLCDNALFTQSFLSLLVFVSTTYILDAHELNPLSLPNNEDFIP